MNKSPHDRYRQHRDIWLLIPWYANGSLNPEERRLVEMHAEICIACKRELAIQSALLEKVRQPDSLDIAAATSFSKLQKRMRGNYPTESTLTGIPGWFGGSFGIFAARLTMPKTSMFAAFSFLIFLPLLLFGWHSDREVDTSDKNGFRTLSSQKITPLAANQIRLVINGEIGQTSFMALMRPVRVIDKADGPDGVGIYTLTLKDAAEVSALLPKLKTNPDVILAESSQSQGLGIRP